MILIGIGAILVIGAIVALALIPLYIRSNNRTDPRSSTETIIFENLASLERIDRLIVSGLNASIMINFVCIFNIFVAKFYVIF